MGEDSEIVSLQCMAAAEVSVQLELPLPICTLPFPRNRAFRQVILVKKLFHDKGNIKLVAIFKRMAFLAQEHSLYSFSMVVVD